MPETASTMVSGIIGASRTVSITVGVLAASMAMSLGNYLVDWWGVLVHGDTPGHDEWLALATIAWLPVVAVTTYRLIKANAALADAAQESQEAFQDTVQTADGWFWRIDADGQFVYSSSGAREILGYDTEELLGRDAFQLLVHDEDRSAALDKVATSSENGWDDWRLRLRHRDGTMRHVRTSATPVHGKGGRILGFRGFTADITAEVTTAAADEALLAQQQAARKRIEQVMEQPAALQIVFQPIVDLRTNRAKGVEALSRFAGEPSRPPNIWYDEAWQFGLGTHLELHAISLALAALPRLPADAYLSVNASPQTIVDGRLHRLLAGLGPDASRIVVEVTEHAVVGDYPALNSAVEQLRSTGARLAVDDAGAGYASMQLILRLRPDVIKLDRSIVAGIHEDMARRALVTAMVGFASSLNMAIVAEGVETVDEATALTSVGITTVQGYLVARPSPDPAPQLHNALNPA